MHTDPTKEKLRAILTSEFGITNEEEIEARIEDMMNPARDMTKIAGKAERVYPTPYGFKTRGEIQKEIDDSMKEAI